MNRKQFIALFVCSLVPWTIGNGLVPLLPVYALELGASSLSAGYFMAVSYLALAAGSLSASFFSDRLQKRRLSLVVAGALAVPVLVWMGFVRSMAGLTISLMLVWFLGGLGLALLNILTGLFADEARRGKIFGLMGLSGGLGALLGGVVFGYLADLWGFSGLFFTIAVFSTLWPLSALLVQDRILPGVGDPGKGGSSGTPAGSEPHSNPPALGRSFWILILASLLATVAAFIGILGRSLVMAGSNFTATQISLTGAVTGLVTLPLPFLTGWLSDRLGRKGVLVACYLLGIGGLVVISFAGVLWQFLLAMLLVSFILAMGGPVVGAWITDLVPAQALGRGMAMNGMVMGVGGVVGFALGGMVFQNMNAQNAFLLAMLLVLAAVLVLAWVRSERDP